jgi:hypothetical protein
LRRIKELHGEEEFKSVWIRAEFVDRFDAITSRRRQPRVLGNRTIVPRYAVGMGRHDRCYLE